MTRRTERIGEQLRATLAKLLREEATDPRLGAVTITLTRVDVSPGLSHAALFCRAFDAKARGDDDPAARERLDAAADGLESAASFLRRRIAQELDLRRAPALDFRRDASFVRAAQTLDLLRRVNDGE